MTRSPQETSSEQGQVLAIFALALVAIVAMAGLVLDGGSTFVQRRDMQNVADAAALAAAYEFTNTGSVGQAQQAARDTAAANGYNPIGSDVRMTFSTGMGVNGAATVTVSIQRPHRNTFSGVVGMPSWDVSTTATAMTGAPNAALGAMPLIFNQKAFPVAVGPDSIVAFNEPPVGGEDVPQTGNQFNWTVFCTADGRAIAPNVGSCNADSTTVDKLINNLGTSTMVDLTMDISPLNSGSHTTLFFDMAEHIGEEFPVSIVNDDGAMVGWAMFHLTGSVGGDTKQVQGYFVDPYNGSGIFVAQGGGAGTSAFGTYVVKLVN
jgi:Flp pilus assembly protein TadG